MSPDTALTAAPENMGAPESATGECSVRFDIQSPSSHKPVEVTHEPTREPAAGPAETDCAKQSAPYSPPESNNATKSDPAESELSDIGEDLLDVDMLDDAAPADPPAEPPADDDIGEIYPDHWSGAVPVFKPTMREFKDFKLYMEKVNWYGMRSGIIKIIPPQEWKDAQPNLDDLVKQIRVRDPIKQEIMGSSGTYRQVNFVHQRSYTLRQWRDLCEQSEHQPPARRGERRLNSDRPRAPRPRAAPTKSDPSASTARGKRGRGRPARNRGRQVTSTNDSPVEDRPMTPVSDKQEGDEGDEQSQKTKQPESDQADGKMEVTMPSIEAEEEEEEVAPAPRRRMGGGSRGGSKTQSTSARRKYSRREGSVMIDEEHFKDFEYEMDISSFTPERCEELERAYWKTLTYAPPLYGADLMGTLFDDRTEEWNLNKLPNLLDVLGTKVPGVNTAYLYLGMWKATFAWHLEDVDLYSINYLHFGAPKQWYSIAQADARRFEAAMKTIWPTEGKACDQFLRHKSFLISPSHLLNNFGIKVNKCVSYPGEFVVTYPYGYHSGYNLGYNCAEAVNFALDSWLPMGKIAKKCDCALAQDSVWVDVHEIERKLRGEETEYEETEDEEEEDASALPTPPDTTSPNAKASTRKRKRVSERKPKQKKTRLRVKIKEEPPCCLCPNDIPGAEILPTEDGGKAHRMCALYLPETYIDTVGDAEVVMNVSAISKERKDLRCLYCRSKRGACFQCSQKTCARAYHATCAAAAGVFVEETEVPVFGDDGTEYKEQAFEFSCRFHRTKRDRRLDGSQLEADDGIRRAAKGVKQGEICQFQYFKGDVFAGVVAENRQDEETFLVDIIPKGERIEVEWKWLLLPDPSDFHLPKASPNALPLPSSRKAKAALNAKRAEDETPRKGAEFAPGYTWTEFNTYAAENSEQAKVDLAKGGVDNKLWFYLGERSTDAKAQYTSDLARREHDPRSNFLGTIPKPPRPSKYAPPNFGDAAQRPYVYKPRVQAQGTATPVGAPGPSFGAGHHYPGGQHTSLAFQAHVGPGVPGAGQAPQQTRPGEHRAPGPAGGNGSHGGPRWGSQPPNGPGGQHYQSYQYSQNGQHYQGYKHIQGYQHYPHVPFPNRQPQAHQPQTHQPPMPSNPQTAPSGSSYPSQAGAGPWTAAHGAGNSNASRSGPSPIQGSNALTNQRTSTLGSAPVQQAHPPTVPNQPTAAPGPTQQAARPVHAPGAQNHWPGYASGGYTYSSSYQAKGGQYPQAGRSAPPTQHATPFFSPSSGTSSPPGTPATAAHAPYSTAHPTTTPSAARPTPPLVTAAPGGRPHAQSPSGLRPQQPSPSHAFEPRRAPGPAPTNVQYDKISKACPPMKQSPVPLPAKYLAAMAKPATVTPKKAAPPPPTPQRTTDGSGAAPSAPRISTTPIPIPVPGVPGLGDKLSGGIPRSAQREEGAGGGEDPVELPEVPADSSAYVERMISNLHRVSGRVEG